jgi:hypothetical protein
MIDTKTDYYRSQDLARELEKVGRERASNSEDKTNTRVILLLAGTLGLISSYSIFKPVSDNNYKAGQIIESYQKASPQEKAKWKIEAKRLYSNTTSNPRDEIGNISPAKRDALERIVKEQ